MLPGKEHKDPHICGKQGTGTAENKQGPSHLPEIATVHSQFTQSLATF